MTQALAAVAMFLCSPTTAAAGDFAVALIPPRDVTTTTGLGRSVGLELSVPVHDLSPEELVDERLFTPERYPLAVYSGFERYIYTVKEPGDAAQALLRYVRAGGVLLVAGRAWPFYRAVDVAGGQYVASTSGPAQFEGPADAWLAEQMQTFNQTATGSYNRFLGLNISGEGTEQFEAPLEGVTFITTERGREAMPSLPETFAFPSGGDLRFRPASGANLREGVSLTVWALARGESAKVYGPGISLVDHAEGGAVIYIWGTLLDTALGLDMMRDAVVYAGAATATEEEAEAVAAVTGRAQALRERAGGLRAQLGEAAPDDALGRYLGREVARQAARVELLVGMAKVRRVEAAEARAASMDEALATVERRLGEATR